MRTNINDLKYSLGKGAGIRKNKYMIEIPIAGTDGHTFNILCKSASLPSRTINVASVWRNGRKYNMRAETDYGGNYEVTILDDSDMTIRKSIDRWMKKVDNSTPAGTSASSFELDFIDNIINTGQDILNTGINYFFGTNSSLAEYQTDINIWQLDNNGNKIYGYKLQNAFPTMISELQYDDAELDTLADFNISFTFSEFEPIINNILNI